MILWNDSGEKIRISNGIQNNTEIAYSPLEYSCSLQRT